MSNLIRRALSTVPHSHAGPSTPPSIALTAPQAVKRRREQSILNANPTSSPSIAVKPGKTLPARLEAEFQALRAQGQYKGDEASGRKVFWDKQVLGRSRVRGVKASKGKFIAGALESDSTRTSAVEEDEGSMVEGKKEDEMGKIIGQRIYLPNIQIRLMRNHTPPGTPYDPHQATFRIPHSMTKTDLRSYLSTLYAFQPTFIRTDNYFAPTKRMPGGMIKTQVGSIKSYKRAVIGLEEPFHYPDDVDELNAQGKEMGVGDKLGEKRKEFIEENFLVETMKGYKKKALMKFHKGYRWRGKTHDNGVSFNHICQ